MVDVNICSIQIDRNLCEVRYFDSLVPRQARWALAFTNEKVRFKEESN